MTNMILLSKISNNHHRFPNFFRNIEQIILILRDDILQHFSSEQMFRIFYENKKIILFFIKNGIINPDQSFYDLISDPKLSVYHYKEYFYPELNGIANGIQQYENYNQDEHEAKRNLGENDHFLCNLIRNDSIIDFISHVTRTNTSLLSKIEPSIFETNSFLLLNNPTLVEYAAFYGSIQIVKYLQLNNVNLTSQTWNYAIHSQNSELIHLLEESGVKPDDGYIKNYIKESLICHHNEITQYLIDNYSIRNSNEKNAFLPSVKYFNFCFFPKNLTDKFVFYDLCAYNYPIIVKNILKEGKIDVNYKIIQKNQLFKSSFNILSIF